MANVHFIKDSQIFVLRSQIDENGAHGDPYIDTVAGWRFNISDYFDDDSILMCLHRGYSDRWTITCPFTGLIVMEGGKNESRDALIERFNASRYFDAYLRILHLEKNRESFERMRKRFDDAMKDWTEANRG